MTHETIDSGQEENDTNTSHYSGKYNIKNDGLAQGLVVGEHIQVFMNFGGGQNVPKSSRQSSSNGNDHSQASHYQTIDTTEVVHQFRQLMQPNSSFHILRLVGEGKMGKSHLLTKVFPHLAQQEYQARWVLLDLSYQFHTVPDILSQACAQCNDQNFDSYYAADQAWSSRPKVDVRGFITAFSRIGISAKEGIDDAHAGARHLTMPFVKDVGKLCDKSFVFFFDSIDQASEEMRMWLTEMLLISLARLDHVRVVIAGRSLPEAHGSYRSRCQSYQLLPIKDLEAYIAYCQQVNPKPKLSEQSIRDLVHAFDYIPGLFAEVLLKFPL